MVVLWRWQDSASFALSQQRHAEYSGAVWIWRVVIYLPVKFLKLGWLRSLLARSPGQLVLTFGYIEIGTVASLFRPMDSFSTKAKNAVHSDYQYLPVNDCQLTPQCLNWNLLFGDSSLFAAVGSFRGNSWSLTSENSLYTDDIVTIYYMIR